MNMTKREWVFAIAACTSAGAVLGFGIGQIASLVVQWGDWFDFSFAALYVTIALPAQIYTLVYLIKHRKDV